MDIKSLEQHLTPFINLIKDYSMRNPRSPVVIRNEEDGDMAIMRRRTNDARLKHNRSK